MFFQLITHVCNLKELASDLKVERREYASQIDINKRVVFSRDTYIYLRLFLWVTLYTILSERSQGSYKPTGRKSPGLICIHTQPYEYLIGSVWQIAIVSLALFFFFLISFQIHICIHINTYM